MFLFFILSTLRMLVRPAMKRLFCLKAKNGLGRFAPSALPHYDTWLGHEPQVRTKMKLHMYGVFDTAVLHVHSSCTCIHLHIYPLHTYITYRLHNEVKVLPHARPCRPQKCPAASRDDASACARARVGCWSNSPAIIG